MARGWLVGAVVPVAAFGSPHEVTFQAPKRPFVALARRYRIESRRSFDVQSPCFIGHSIDPSLPVEGEIRMTGTGTNCLIRYRRSIALTLALVVLATAFAGLAMAEDGDDGVEVVDSVEESSEEQLVQEEVTESEEETIETVVTSDDTETDVDDIDPIDDEVTDIVDDPLGDDFDETIDDAIDVDVPDVF